jgi:hypothetical protein
MTALDGLRPDRADRDVRLPGSGKPRVYLHIGEPKTGTTFLQQCMWANHPQLAEQGVLLPGYSHQDHSLASRDLRETPKLASDPAASWRGEWDVLIGEALRAGKPAVISDELLVACTPAQAGRGVRSLLAAELHVIVTVRDITSLLPAEWQESVKVGGTAPWEDWLKSVMETAPATDRRARSWFWTVHSTLANLGMWAQHIPPSQVHVITVPRQGSPDALWTRFASVLGVDPGSIAVHPERANPSLGLAEAEFLRRMNEALPPDMPRWYYTRNIKRLLALNELRARPHPSRLQLPPEHGDWAREQAEILVAGLRESKYHIVGDLADLLPRPTTGRYTAPGDLGAEQLLDVAVHAAAALADYAYREGYPVKEQRELPRNPRQLLSRLKWTVLNGPRARRILRNASDHAVVRRLRVAIWCLLMRPRRGA